MELFIEICKRCLFAVFLSLILISFVSCGTSPESRFEQLVSEGRASFAKRDYKEALGLWEDALRMQPESVDVMNRIAKAYLHLAEFSQAERMFKTILEKKPGAGDILLELTRLQLIAGHVHDAVSNWKKLEGIYPDDPGVKALYGDFLVLEGKFEEAEIHYREAAAVLTGGTISSAGRSAVIRLASCYAAQGKAELAQQTFDMAGVGDNETTDILLQAANFWKLMDDMGRAEAVLKQAVRAEPEDLSLRMVTARFYFDAGRYDDAKAVIDKLIETSPGNRPFRKYLMKILLAQNRLEKIPAMLERYGSEMENDMEFNLLAGRYHLLEHHTIIAEEHFKRVVRENPDYFMAHYLLGVTYLLGERIYLARQSLIKALSLNPVFSDAEILLADIYYKNGEFDFSREHLSRVIEREPENFRAHMMTGSVRMALRQYKRAMEAFQTAFALNPESESAMYYIALASDRIGETDRAVKIYKRLLEKNPRLADAAWQLKELWVKTGKTGPARTYFETAVREYPENGYLHYILGEVYVAAGKPAEAEKSFRKAVEVLPGLTSSYIRLAELYSADMQADRRVKVLEACSDQSPDFLDCYLALAGIYLEKGETGRAVEIFEKALLNIPESPVLANNLAFLYLDQGGDLNRAFELARMAYKQMPDSPAALDTLGWAYYHKKMYGRAVEYLKRAADLEPDNSVVQEHLRLGINGVRY